MKKIDTPHNAIFTYISCKRDKGERARLYNTNRFPVRIPPFPVVEGFKARIIYRSFVDWRVRFVLSSLQRAYKTLCWTHAHFRLTIEKLRWSDIVKELRFNKRIRYEMGYGDDGSILILMRRFWVFERWLVSWMLTGCLFCQRWINKWVLWYDIEKSRLINELMESKYCILLKKWGKFLNLFL